MTPEDLEKELADINYTIKCLICSLNNLNRLVNTYIPTTTTTTTII